MGRIQSTLALGVSLFVIASCGGSVGESGAEMEDAAEDEMTQQPQPSLNPIFVDEVKPGPSDLVAMYSFARSTGTTFDEYNRLPFHVPQSANANYKGSIVLQRGEASEFLHGDMVVGFDFLNGFGTGEIKNISISGADTNNRLESVFSTLDVAVASFEAADFKGIITGDLLRESSTEPVGETYEVDAVLDGSFVRAPLRPSAVGIVAGTLKTSIQQTTDSLEGVFEMQDQCISTCDY